MKQRISSVLLSLLLLLSLTACATEIQGSHSAVIHGIYGASDSVIDLPVQELGNGSQAAPEGNQNLPDGNQAPSNDENENVNQAGEKGDDGNREGLLPKERGRTYTECDIDTVGKNSRGAKRIVFSNDGLVYYTDDHYESFELLYGEP